MLMVTIAIWNQLNIEFAKPRFLIRRNFNWYCERFGIVRKHRFTYIEAYNRIERIWYVQNTTSAAIKLYDVCACYWAVWHRFRGQVVYR